MRQRQIAIIGNAMPRRCGIATFTDDLQRAIEAQAPGFSAGIVAMNDAAAPYAYGADVLFAIDDQNEAQFVAAADRLNKAHYGAVLLQHEFGIFGGEAGALILALTSRLSMPLITTLHTVLADPSPGQRRVMEGLKRDSARFVVMAQKGAELLRSVYGVRAERIDIIPHGIPDIAFAETTLAKAKLGYAGRRVILTFGLLSPARALR